MEVKMKSIHLTWLAFFCLFMLVMFGCNFASIPRLAQNNSEEITPTVNTTRSGQFQSTENEPSQPTLTRIATVPDPLKNLLALRSIRITQTSHRPDGTLQSILVEIDASGNMHVAYSMPVVSTMELPKGANLTTLDSSHEIYVIAGNAYVPSETDPLWTSNPVSTDYASVLSGQMHGLDGFTTWLDLLPKGSLQDSGIETVGGFSTNKYTVNGKIDDQQITGMLWYNTHSLVQAELHIPAALDSNPEKPVSGEIVISLKAQQAKVAPIVLPSN
jgi:hypothetical protein